MSPPPPPFFQPVFLPIGMFVFIVFFIQLKLYLISKSSPWNQIKQSIFMGNYLVVSFILWIWEFLTRSKFSTELQQEERYGSWLVFVMDSLEILSFGGCLFQDIFVCHTGLWPLRSDSHRETDNTLVLSFVGQTR